MKSSALFRIALPVVILLGAILVAVTMVRMRPHAGHQRPGRPHPLVEVLAIDQAPAGVTVTGFGTVQAKRRIDITPQVSGLVIAKSSRFEAGETVAAGDTLLAVEQTDYRQGRALAASNLAAARTALAQAEQEAAVARSEWERVHPGAPASPLVLKQPQVAQARALVEANLAALDLAEANLARCFLIAPFTGRIEAAAADVGQVLRAGTPVGAMYATDVAEITVPVPAADMAWIRCTDPATGFGGDSVRVEVDFAGATHVWQGIAARLGGVVDAASRQVPVVVEIPDPEPGDRPDLLPGMFAKIVFTGQPPAGAVSIPRDALRAGNIVWVVNPDTTLSLRPVQVAKAGTEYALITGGLSCGETICTSNLQVVTEGMPVRLQGEPENAPRGEEDSE